MNFHIRENPHQNLTDFDLRLEWNIVFGKVCFLVPPSLTLPPSQGGRE
ncbi:MAG: hypothetical protein LBQ24_01500 [Candidatus Peribacteria bacterium]|nr:hypothetical protein [Candidatus Peribacteria bacterium]